MYLLALANSKQKAIEAAAPNAVFEPGTTIYVLTIIFFIVAVGMMWLIIRAGKGKDYGD